jgi:DNA polymerase I
MTGSQFRAILATAMRFEENCVLFGHDPAARIVAVELSGESEVSVYRRSPDGASTEVEKAPFRPFLWLEGEQEGIESEPLAGDLAFNRIVHGAGWADFNAVRADLRDRPKVRHFALTDPIQQYLTATGRTLFKGMDFAELRRMQIDIETFCSPGFEFSNADRPGDHLMAIAVSDHTGWEELILVDRNDVDKSERAALERLTALIRERDPDVLEGHNLFKFDLPYIAARARRRRVKLDWGRDGTVLTSRASRVQIAERTINYPKFEARGRHIVDTFLLVQLYDIGTRELESFGLKDVARHFGIAGGGGEQADQRTYLEGLDIQKAYEDDPDTFRAYALDDVRETRALSSLLSGSYFIQAQIFPYNYQEVIVRGNATRINALFLREYYRRGHSISDLPEARSFEGGYTDVFITGVERNVHHCDVASLYPSVMLRYDIFPAPDKLGIFRGLLADLRTFRLEAKAKMRESAPRSREFQSYHALQNVFKVLINSFYGYLGFSQGHFADYDAAARVTETGRDLLKKMVAWLNEQGARVIEIDTDGIYFSPPPNRTTAQLQKGLTKILPEGIEIEFDAQYQAMFSYKAKNYALLGLDGSLILKGGALKSRGLEKFQRQYIERTIRLLLEGRPEEIAALRKEFETAIRERRWHIDMLAKTDTLQDSLGQYQKKIEASARNRSAAYELAMRSGRGYQPGDQISHYITGTKKKVSSYESAKLASEWRPDARDENVEYYVSKLDELAKKYTEFTGPTASAPVAEQGEMLF